MSFALIRTAADHQKCLKRLEKLMEVQEDSADDIGVLSLIIQDWEQKKIVIEAPTAVDAIRFRMERQNLKSRDLEPFIGSRSRVSEILAGTRPLTVDMIRALNQHLGIPASALINQSTRKAEKVVPPSKAAMEKLRTAGVLKAKESFEAFVARAFPNNGVPALLRKTRTGRTNAKSDPSALQAWCAAVQIIAEKQTLPSRVAKKPTVADGRKLAKLSAQGDGLHRVRGELGKMGVALVILDHLPGTFLDGAAMRRQSDEAPVIALTRRHDRIDNFWFTLLHEYMHVVLHLSSDQSLILDDLEVQGVDAIEDEADRNAQKALIPDTVWTEFDHDEFDLDDLERAARKAGVHPAIVAGRWQREHNDYRRFSKFVGRGEVRNQDI